MKTIAVLAYPDCQLLDVAGPLQVFATANQLLPAPGYEVVIIARNPGPVVTNSGMVLLAQRGLCDTGDLDTLLVAGGYGVEAACRDRLLTNWLVARSTEVRRLGSVCTGAFLLAEAGLLRGRRAVTHWKHCRRLADRHPDIRVEPDALYLCDHNIYSSAGVTAGIDLALALLRDDQGHRLAADVARELVMFMHRPGGQSQFSTGLVQQAPMSAPLRRAVEGIRQAPARRFTLESLAERAAVSPRHLSRLFRRELDLSAGDFIERVRIERAQRALEEADGSLSTIAEHCGFGSADRMRCIFIKRLGISPSEYRQRFSVQPSQLQGFFS
ncbi:GlxA family transcriptional regulator [Marinobacterium sedimentorum]|uniref:GlxA family transcriptional regulator n=1 Tax=Marinobacterium sedimentorum TaxID=2927804 RepID=UPI0020C62F69|nr:GlxA family transcriptional regulator [Marinobacterium sedimentorum]MCP8687806.1 GlxA family transcriptional regulator [Marinobacterium sedimentorum]